MGTLAIPLKHLKAEKNMAVTQPYSLQAAGPDNAVLYLHLELRVGRPSNFSSYQEIVSCLAD